MRHGFKAENISIISEGIELEPLTDIAAAKKFDHPTILSLGSIRPMKRTLDILRGFELLKSHIPDAKLVIAGNSDGAYGKKLLSNIDKSQHSGSIIYAGQVSREEKLELMRRSHIIAVTSVKEGWGLIVTEAASQACPAVVYV